MKICLVFPPYNSVVKAVLGVSSPPLGLAYLASILKTEHQVKIIDANILEYDLNGVRKELKSYYPDVVGITCSTPSIYHAHAVARIAKEVRENCIVIIGGPHVTFLPKQTLQECRHLDVVVKGEGEETVEELMNTIGKGEALDSVKGIAFRKRGQIVDNEPRRFIKNIDEISFPSWELLPSGAYQANGIRYATMMTSRGCPFRCSFCSSSRLFGCVWRGRSPGNVLEEMKIIHDEYGIRNIEFLDDTFTLNQERAGKICDGIIGHGLDVSWTASSRVDTVSRKLAEKMKKAGCWTLFLGVESGSQKILDEIGKRITVDQVKKAVRIVKEAGIQVLGSFTLGFLQDSVETIKQTLNFAKSLQLDYAQFSILTPYPGTPIFDYALKNNLLLTKDWSRYTVIEPVMRIEGVTPKQLIALLQKAYLSFYIRPKVVLGWIKNKQLSLMRNGIKAAINFLSKNADMSSLSDQALSLEHKPLGPSENRC